MHEESGQEENLQEENLQEENLQEENRYIVSTFFENIHVENTTENAQNSPEVKHVKETPNNYIILQGHCNVIVDNPIEGKNNLLILNKNIEEAQIVLENERNIVKSIMDSKAEEMTKLIHKAELVEDEKLKMVNEITQIDCRKADLMQLCDVHIALIKLKTKQDKLDSFISKALQDSKTKTTNLKIHLKELEARKAEENNLNHYISQQTKLNNHNYIESINLKISSKEQELECPVCLETATTPILMCEEQHLICHNCR